MFKILLKKQLLELGEIYTPKKQRGKGRKKGFLLLYAFVFLCLMLSLGAMMWQMCDGLIGLNAGGQSFDWLYFLIVFALMLVIGIVGSAFGAYTTLYRAKDNDTLLAMPIPPRAILFARMTSVFVTGLVFELIVFLPAAVVYFIKAGFSFGALIGCVINLFSVSLIALSLSCFFGWIIALISAHTRNKSFVTVLASVILMAVYYVVYFRMSELMREVVLNAVIIGEKLEGSLLVVIGRSFTGDIGGIALILGAAALLFALTVVLLERNYSSVVTTNKGHKQVKYKMERLSQKGLTRALLNKEFRRFTQSPAYMLNCGLGLIIMLGALVYALIKFSALKETLSALDSMEGELTWLQSLKGFLPAAIVAFVLSTAPISAPSVSLEGHSVWILRMLPVGESKIFIAKQLMHILLTLPLSLICAAVFGMVLGLDAIKVITNLLFVSGYALFLSALGLALGLKKPNLDWTNENVPVKQGMAVSITLLGGMLLPIALMILSYALLKKDIDIVPLLWIIPWAAACILERWIFTRGKERFRELS